MEENGSIHDFALINSLLSKLPPTWILTWCYMHMFFNCGARHCAPNWYMIRTATLHHSDMTRSLELKCWSIQDQYDVGQFGAVRPGDWGSREILGFELGLTSLLISHGRTSFWSICRTVCQSPLLGFRREFHPYFWTSNWRPGWAWKHTTLCHWYSPFRKHTIKIIGFCWGWEIIRKRWMFHICVSCWKVYHIPII